MRSLRSEFIGSMRAWLPSRRSTAHQRGAFSMRFVGHVRSGSSNGICSWKGVLLERHSRRLLGVDHRVTLFVCVSLGVRPDTGNSATRRAGIRPRRGREEGGSPHARPHRMPVAPPTSTLRERCPHGETTVSSRKRYAVRTDICHAPAGAQRIRDAVVDVVAVWSHRGPTDLDIRWKGAACPPQRWARACRVHGRAERQTRGLGGARCRGRSTPAPAG